MADQERADEANKRDRRALSAGAAALASGALSEAGKYAYNRLRGAILRVVSSEDLEKLEQKPNSEYRKVLEEELAEAGKAEDSELAELARQMITVLLEETGAVGATGISLGEIKVINIRLRDIIIRRGDLVAGYTGSVALGGSADGATIITGDGNVVVSRTKVNFTVYHQKEIKPEVWCTLLAYVHLLKMQSTVEADAKQRLEVPHGRRFGEATYDIRRGAEIVVAPELPGCRFNPTSARLLWLEDWHRVEFRLQAQPELAGFELGKAVNGRVAFYVESVLVGDVPIWTCISDEADTTAADTPTSTASAEPYEAIFVSYAHEDSAVVNRLGRAYKALGMEFLRDVEKLRSGEQWNPALLAMIEEADIFQLYWSCAAKRSRYVKQEWRHAFKQERSHFIRPLYWQLPMPQPPRKLAQLNFSYIELDN